MPLVRVCIVARGVAVAVTCCGIRARLEQPIDRLQIPDPGRRHQWRRLVAPSGACLYIGALLHQEWDQLREIGGNRNVHHWRTAVGALEVRALVDQHLGAANGSGGQGGA